jgi:hypothetical protein
MKQRASSAARLLLFARNGPSAWALIPALLVSFVLDAQTPKPTEYQVQAAYLSNFARFVEWPAKAAVGGEPFYVCVLGQDPFGAALDTALKRETIGGAPMAAKRITAAEDAAGCRIVFLNASFSSSRKPELKAILAALAPLNALTVSDMSDFTKRGGMIQFVLEGNRVRFEINLRAARNAGLTLSSELLRVAVAVRREP